MTSYFQCLSENHGYAHGFDRISFRTHTSSLEGATELKWYPVLPESNFSDSGQKAWTIVLVHRISFRTDNSIFLRSYYDEVTGQTFRAHTVFKLHIQPDTYSVCVSDDQLEMESGSSLQTQLVWCATERTYLVHSLLVKMLPMD